MNQRIWIIRTDGSDLHPVRVQKPGEAVGHEFWWPGGQTIGYKYFDLRKNPERNRRNLEYLGEPMRLGIASLDGKERWLSPPVKRYQSHLIVSPDEQWLCGDGTDGWCAITVAPFNPKAAALEFEPLATTHAAYRPVVGASIDAGFSADSRWSVFNDWVDWHTQVCAVEVS